MAKELFLAPSTVKTHVQRLYEKLGVSDRGRRRRRGDAPQAAGVAWRAPSNRFVDYFAAEPVRVSAILRLPLIGLIAVLVWIWEVDHWLPGLYAVILGVYAVAAVLWLIAVLQRAGAPVGGLGVDGRRPAGDHHAVPGVGRRDRGAAAGVLPAADLGGVPGPAGVDGDHRNRHGAGLSRGVDLLLRTRRQGRIAEHGVHALRLPALAGRRDDRAVLSCSHVGPRG